MKAFLFPLAVMASSVMAQTTTACGADYIVSSCLSSETMKLNTCGDKDYGCRCAAWKNILTCYNNCPNDPRQHNDEGQRQIWCGYASQFPSSTAAVPTQTGAATAAQSTQDAQGDSTEGGDSASATTSSSGPADTNSAASLALNAGGVLAAVAGVFAVVL